MKWLAYRWSPAVVEWMMDRTIRRMRSGSDTLTGQPFLEAKTIR
jgi:hypothetical protein